jgi:predicted Zn-dependent peptidase
VGTYIACSPEKKDEALGGIKRVLETLADRGPTRLEMKRAKEFYLGRRAMDLQGDSAIAGHLGMKALYGLEHLSEQVLTRKVNAVSAKELQAICRKYLVEPYMVTSVVG